MTSGNSNIDPEKYEPNTVREKDSICPFIGKSCVKDPMLCGRYQPFNIIEMRLNVPQVKTVYMCVDDALRVTTETILNLMQALAQPQAGRPRHGFQGLGLNS